MSKITYTNKVALNQNRNVQDIYKVNAADMNEIKNVVNANSPEEKLVTMTGTITLPANQTSVNKSVTLTNGLNASNCLIISSMYGTNGSSMTSSASFAASISTTSSTTYMYLVYTTTSASSQNTTFDYKVTFLKTS